VQRSMLIFGIALLALMSGALFYAAQAPVRQGASPPAEPAAESKSSAPASTRVAFALNDVDGVAHDFSEFAGSHTLLNFWATWCAPCRREIPLLKDFHAGKDNHDIQVIGIAVDFPEEVAIYAEAAEFNYPILVGEEDAMAVAESSGVEFVGLPFTMIVSREGELLNAHMGEIHQEELNHIADVLARLDAGAIDTGTAKTELRGL
jgi:thiol-disulfide isomerase/thioredoxin